MADLSLQYLETVQNALELIKTKELASINKAGVLIGQTIAAGKLFHLFGSGHSDLIAIDSHIRAGGLACANRIVDPTKGQAERIENYAESLLKMYDLRPGEVIVIISNSGRNAAPVETALYAGALGLKVVAITSLSHSEAVSSRHFSGKKLFQIADIVIDTHGPLGDACIQIGEGLAKVGPVSTVLGAAILNMIIVKAATTCVELTGQAPLYSSQNLDGMEESNRQLWGKYQNRLGPYAL